MAVRDVVQAAAGVGGGSEYVEDVFSTYLYTGTNATQTITNGIDLDGEGGMIWTKGRTTATDHYIVDTERGINQGLFTNSTAASTDHTSSATVTAFNSDGYTLGSDSTWLVNWSGNPDYASWTFRKAPKFFDVVTWTGDGVSGREIPHSLGSVPGCIIIKRTNASSVWTIFHNGLSGGITGSRLLFDTGAATVGSNITAVDDSTFTVISTGVNNAGGTYVAYLFAHDAGGFGDDGEQNVISCGSLTADNAGGGAYTGGATVNLGYEPQFVLLKQADSTLSSPDWMMLDIQRGYVAQETSGNDVGQKRLKANTSEAEGLAGGASFPISTGF